MAKAANLPADGVIFDLEDSVSSDQLPSARQAISAALKVASTGHQSRFVRINALGTAAFDADVALIKQCKPDGVVVPKIDRKADIDVVLSHLGAVPLWPMIETPRAILDADAITSHPMVQGIILGPNDLAKDLRVQNDSTRSTILLSLQLCILAARANGVIAIDGVYNRFKDIEGYRIECDQGRALGFDGKSLIHPSQIEDANARFRPSADEVARARAMIDAYEAAVAEGKSVGNMDGEMVEELHANDAKALLARVTTIEEIEKG